ncbi:alpha-ribazole phosphatase [Prolixibacteraceae bacterium JC049]|nr:alpha-ribazole phosphatase [Prolixibacteraceae bacterium JC049]
MIYLIRHTTPDIPQGVCYGHSDIEVATSFNAEKNRVVEKLTPNSHIEVISSPLIRCKKLAKAIFPFRPIEKDSRLKEMDFGEWEMKKWAAIDQDVLKEWGDNFVADKPHGGESFQDLYDRVSDFWNSLDHSSKDYAIVTHSGVIRCILAQLLGIPLSKAFVLKIAYAEVIKIEALGDDNYTVEFVQN